MKIRYISSRGFPAGLIECSICSAKIQYTAGKILSGALHLTVKETLNAELAWESIQVRADFLGL